MKLFRLRSTDILYAAIWVVVILLYMLDVVRGRVTEGADPVLGGMVLVRILLTLLPFLALFVYNNYLLIPRFLLPGRLRAYLFALLPGLLLVMALQYGDFLHQESTRPHFMVDGIPFAPPRRLFPLPLLLHYIYDILVIGGNIAIALIFQRYYDNLDRERLLKANAQNELSYLKAQINPHFYMNMLNNIHGMIEIDPEGAQEMVMDMSRLMRYMLYDSSRATTTLDKEVDFIRTYLNIMRRRSPESRVRISAELPGGSQLRTVELPPLLFLVFIENAFKHGISYHRRSFVEIAMSLDSETLHFRIINSLAEEPGVKKTPGIGLANVRQRLGLIYGDAAKLSITETADTYLVNLSIPIHETSDNSN